MLNKRQYTLDEIIVEPIYIPRFSRSLGRPQWAPLLQLWIHHWLLHAITNLLNTVIHGNSFRQFKHSIICTVIIYYTILSYRNNNIQTRSGRFISLYKLYWYQIKLLSIRIYDNRMHCLILPCDITICHACDHQRTIQSLDIFVVRKSINFSNNSVKWNCLAFIMTLWDIRFRLVQHYLKKNPRPELLHLVMCDEVYLFSFHFF